MAIPPRIAGAAAAGGGGRKPRMPPLPPARTLLTAFAAAAALAVLCLVSSSSSSSRTSSLRGSWGSAAAKGGKKYLYWGARVDCPGKHCGTCAGLGHQESSLRCALEEALFLGRIFVMPSRMCLSSVHNTRGILHSTNATSEQRFMECKDRKSRSSVMLSYTFLPSMPAKKLRDAANKMKQMLGDYDAIHVRRGDLLKNRKDRFGVERSLHPHLDRDTRPEFIKKRIAKWIPEGRTLFIASNERTPGFFSPLSDKYKLAYSSNFSSILEPIIENNYQLFMVERLMMRGAKTFVKTMKEFDNDLTLCDDPKKNTEVWQIPVYTDD